MSGREKKSVAWWWWPIWWAVLLVADLLFYVLITPFWIALRWLAWVAEFRARRRKPVVTPSGR